MENQRPQTLPLVEVRADGGTQMRFHMDQQVVEEYAEQLRAGAVFPPVVVFYDGAAHWLGDGFHRLEAHRAAGLAEIAVTVKTGTKRDAMLYAAGANANHGLRRTNADKRAAVFALLGDDEWSQWSDREIARVTAVTHPFVAKLRKELSGNGYHGEALAEEKEISLAACEAIIEHGTHEQNSIRYHYVTDKVPAERRPQFYLLCLLKKVLDPAYAERVGWDKLGFKLWVDPFEGQLSDTLELVARCEPVPAVKAAWEHAVHLIYTAGLNDGSLPIASIARSIEQTHLDAIGIVAKLWDEAERSRSREELLHTAGNLHVAILAVAMTSPLWVVGEYPHRLQYWPLPSIETAFDELPDGLKSLLPRDWLPSQPAAS